MIIKQVKLKLMVALALSILSIKAQADGIERGGGHFVEAVFKASAINLAQELSTLPQHLANQHLKFTPGELLGAAYTADPKCAKGNDLAFLKSEMKLAYVKSGNVILLQCYNDTSKELVLKKEWQDLYDSMIGNQKLNIQSKMLLAHEVLRTTGKDGNYAFSGSIAETLFRVARFRSSKIMHMLTDDIVTERCSLRVYEKTCEPTTSGKFVTVRIIQRNYSYNKFCMNNYSGTVDQFKSALVNPSSNDKHVQEVIDHLNNFKCFER